MPAMEGLVFDLVVPYFACFRKPTSTSVLATYQLPPFTTIRGLLACALGWGRWPDVSNKTGGRGRTGGQPAWMDFLQQELYLNIASLCQAGNRPSRELARYLKLLAREGRVEGRKLGSFPSSPIYKYFVVRPEYRIYVAGSDPQLLASIWQALNDPARPPYIGQSDDMVLVYPRWRGRVFEEQKVDQVWGLVPGIWEDAEALRLPKAFTPNGDITYTEVLSLPYHPPVKWSQPAYLFGKGDEQFQPQGVVLYGAAS